MTVLKIQKCLVSQFIEVHAFSLIKKILKYEIKAQTSSVYLLAEH